MKSNETCYLLTFEFDKKSEIIEIHCNQKGLEKLKQMIDSLTKTKAPNHVHLMTNSWGGDELTDEKQGDENIIINHLKIFKWNDR